MAVKLEADKKREQAEAAMLESAVRQIRKNPELRFLFRQIFHMLGTEDGISTSDTNQAFTLIGRQSAGVDIRALLMSFDITLYGELLVEDAQYNKPEPEEKDDYDEE